MAAGDYEKAAQLQEALAVNAQQLQELKRGKKAMKEQKEAAEKEPVRPVPQGDLVDQLAAQVSPRSASWLRESREHLKSERRSGRAHV